MSIHKTYYDSLAMREYGHHVGMVRGAVDLTAAFQAGGQIDLDEGDEFTLTGNVVIDSSIPKLTVRGRGRQKTIINVSGTIEFAASDGEDFSTVPLWHNFEGLTFFGPTGVRSLDFMTFNYASRCRFFDVEWKRMRTAITANRLHDTDFLYCAWSVCGLGVAYPAVILQRATDKAAEDEQTYKSNNVTFGYCIWEPNYGPSLVLAEETRSCRIMNSKWHGPQPEEEWNHLVIEDSHSNEIMGNVFANTDGAGITLDGEDTEGNLIIGNRFAGLGTGIAFANGAVNNAIVANAFGLGAGGNNTNDSTGTTAGNELANNPGYTA
jgi:hypothetical protein